LAHGRKTGLHPLSYSSGAPAPALRAIEDHWQAGFMRHANLLFWLSIAWLVVLCGATVWALVSL
jgi:hypothetical protein